MLAVLMDSFVVPAMCGVRIKLCKFKSLLFLGGSCFKTSKIAVDKGFFFKKLYKAFSSTIPPLDVLIKIASFFNSENSFFDMKL